MSSLSYVITGLLLDSGIKLDRDQLTEAEQSISARMIFDPAGNLITPLKTLVQAEKQARPDLFEKDHDRAK